jgi:hypothetical protein
MIPALIAAIVVTQDTPETAKHHTFKNYAKAFGVICLFLMMFALLGLLELIAPAHGQTRTYQDSMGRETGRSTTNGNTTTFSDSMGRNTGRAVTNGGTTTIYNPLGQQTGTIRSNRR